MLLVSDQRLFEYRIVRLLGQGAFGTVYLAHDMLLDRPVAIKELAVGSQVDDAAIQRFLQEARTAGGLNHPNVVTVYALKVLEPSIYLVMEYVDGGSLRSLMDQRGPLPVEEAARIAADVCDGLTAAHAKGIVHRDVKPENILLARDGRAKVGDFGVAHVPHSARGPALTHTGFQPGTLFYMSPEQIRGQSVDGRSDVYQVGALLYEMLSGQHYIDMESLSRRAREAAGSNVMLFQARLYELLAEAICDQPPRKVRSVREQAPCWLDEAVATALAKDVAARPIASDFSAILREGLDECLALPSDLRWPEMWPMTGGNQSRTGWDGVPVDLQIGRLWLKWAFETGSSIAPSAVAKGMVFAGSEDGHVYALDPNTGQERWGASVCPIEELVGPRHVPIVVERLVLVGSGDGCVYGLDPTSGRLVWKSKTGDSSDGGSVVGLGVADGLVVAVTFGYPANSSVYGLDVETGRRLWIQRDAAFTFGSPIVEQKTILVGGEFDLKAFDVETGDTRWRWDGDDIVANPAAAGGKVFFGASHGVYSLDAATGQELWRFQTGTNASAVTVAGGVVFAGSLDEHVYALDAATGQELWRSKLHGAFVQGTPMAIGNIVMVGDIVLAAVSSAGDFIGAGDERLGPEDLFALDATSGRKIWAVDTGLRATGVTVAGGTVFVGSQGGAILAYSDRVPGVGQRISTVDVAHAEEHWKRAIAYVQDGRLSDAARECEAALYIIPEWLLRWLNRGGCSKPWGDWIRPHRPSRQRFASAHSMLLPTTALAKSTEPKVARRRRTKRASMPTRSHLDMTPALKTSI